MLFVFVGPNAPQIIQTQEHANQQRSPIGALPGRQLSLALDCSYLDLHGVAETPKSSSFAVYGDDDAAVTSLVAGLIILVLSSVVGTTTTAATVGATVGVAATTTA